MLVLNQFVLQGLLGICGSGRQTGHRINDIADQVETVKIVEYHMSNDVVMVPFSL